MQGRPTAETFAARVPSAGPAPPLRGRAMHPADEPVEGALPAAAGVVSEAEAVT